jgi:hypothetical protein
LRFEVFMARSSSSRATSRRRFLKVAGAAGLSAALMSPVVALAQSASRRVPKPPVRPMPVKPDSTSRPEPPSEFVPDAKALTTVIERRYGKHLDAKQLEAVTGDLDDGMQLGKILRGVKLVNSDEPDFTFHA